MTKKFTSYTEMSWTRQAAGKQDTQLTEDNVSTEEEILKYIRETVMKL
jgi:hypothetical protein